MNIGTKVLASSAVLLSAAGTATKVTYDLTVPNVDGKLVKVHIDGKAGEQINVWLPEKLDVEIPKNSKLKMRLGKHKSGSEDCIEVIYQAGEGGVFLLGSLENATYLGKMPICGNKKVWTVIGRDNKPKKLICGYQEVLDLGSFGSDNWNLLRCTEKRGEDSMEAEVKKIKINDKPDAVVCTRQRHTYKFTCQSERDFSIEYAVGSQPTGGYVSPAVRISAS
ncbi:hypothetical protein MHLP_04130 [Candidatus Mycoplasma haematolamae str. Purdue]|uniref:Uncharacterized protein n=1 Tax=Mycoplasma haematolamae (strain Purdue) TaxID=1212765 RepID=I7CGL6_MYCHA|nr:hypothetical protein [Candidatus Mycoplasma haematolamae]AFO52406.1 hypothetical protein MHLP_04130 [Candidatus Mycoplasma haematolamae str. Purdue]